MIEMGAGQGMKEALGQVDASWPSSSKRGPVGVLRSPAVDAYRAHACSRLLQLPTPCPSRKRGDAGRQLRPTDASHFGW